MLASYVFLFAHFTSLYAFTRAIVSHNYFTSVIISNCKTHCTYYVYIITVLCNAHETIKVQVCMHSLMDGTNNNTQGTPDSTTPWDNTTLSHKKNTHTHTQYSQKNHVHMLCDTYTSYTDNCILNT